MRYMEPRIAELSRTIDPAELGRRIRNARHAAGMTQAQVCDGEVSPAYLSRIEDGQRRPEAGLLERMAVRMGTTIDELVLDLRIEKVQELELAVDHAALALASGDPATALASVDQVLEDLGENQAPAIRRAAQQVRAAALEATGDLNGAILVLEDLTAAAQPDASWLRSLIALSRCHRDGGDFNQAITVGEQAAAMIEELGLSGLSEAIELAVTVSGAYRSRGDLDQAMHTCVLALEAAEKHGSPIARASAYWNASTVELAANGASRGAIDLARKALALYELGADNRSLAKVRAELATLQLAQDPADAAAALRTLASAERELALSGASAWEIALLHITRGRAHFYAGDYPTALTSLQLGVEAAPADAPFLHASAASIQGQVAAAEGRSEEAREHYRRAIASLSGAGSDQGAAQLWFELANLLTEVGDTEGALEAFRSAGTSTGLRVQSTAPRPVARS
jgi:tetratricopeptide (TPR) repeat protein